MICAQSNILVAFWQQQKNQFSLTRYILFVCQKWWKWRRYKNISQKYVTTIHMSVEKTNTFVQDRSGCVNLSSTNFSETIHSTKGTAHKRARFARNRIGVEFSETEIFSNLESWTSVSRKIAFPLVHMQGLFRQSSGLWSVSLVLFFFPACPLFCCACPWQRPGHASSEQTKPIIKRSNLLNFE